MKRCKLHWCMLCDLNADHKSTSCSVDTSIVCFLSMLPLSTHCDSECWILIRIVHSACHSLPTLYYTHLYMNVKLISAPCLILITSKTVPSVQILSSYKHYTSGYILRFSTLLRYYTAHDLRATPQCNQNRLLLWSPFNVV